MAPILAPLFGVHFYGGVSPSKLDLLPRLESERNSVQKHVPSYYVKRSPGCVVWAAPTALRGGPSLIMEEQPFSTLIRGADSNPARVLTREMWHD
jgi:hypothetical protein